MFRFGQAKTKVRVETRIALNLNIESDASTLNLTTRGVPDHTRISVEDSRLTFDVPRGESVYLVQEGNSRGFQTLQSNFIPLPDERRLTMALHLPEDAVALGCALYVFLCDEEGAVLVRKALKTEDADWVNFARPNGAVKAFVALRLVGSGHLGSMTLDIAPAKAADRRVQPGVEASFALALKSMLSRAQDEQLTEFMEQVLAWQGPTGRSRYLSAAASEAARAHRHDLEIDFLTRLHEAGEAEGEGAKPGLEQKIARAHYRAGDYARLGETLSRWPHVLDPVEGSPFYAPALEIQAGAAVLDQLRVPHGERYRPVKGPAKAAYCLHNSLPYASGGYATRSHGLMRGLLAAGGSATVFARPGFPSDTSQESPAPEGRSTRRIDGVQYRFENAFGRPGRLYRYVAQAGDYFAETAPQNTTVIQAASNFYTGLAGLHAASQRGLPFIYEVRGFWELTRESRDADYARTPLYRRNRGLEQSCAFLADHVLTLTPSMKAEIESWGVPPERVSLAPNAVDPELFQPLERDAALGGKLGLDPQHVVIGYVGSFVDYEGLDMLVDAAVRLMREDDRVRLLIVGDDTPGGRAAVPVGQQLRDQAERSGMADRIIFTGRVPYETVPAHYSLIDICPFPRLPVPVCEMVSPMKPLEAMAMGKCVITSSVGGMEGMVTHDKTGLIFAKGSGDALHAALKRAVSDKALRRRYGVQARKWIQKERTWETVGKTVAELHDGLLSGDLGMSRRPDDYARAVAAFEALWPLAPVIETSKSRLEDLAREAVLRRQEESSPRIGPG